MGLFTIGLAAMAIHQVVAEARARATVRNRYRAAERAALEAGKPLLVVGGPYGAGPFRHTFNMPEKDSAPAWLAPGHHLWVRETGPGAIEIEERRGDRRRAAVRAQATRPLMGVAV